MLSSVQRERIDALFDGALDAEPASRRRWVEEACDGDTVVLNEVMSLLRAHQQASGILDEPAMQVAARLVRDVTVGSPDEKHHHLGAYRLVTEIGRGGMGCVFLGERADAQFEQRAAIKVLHLDCNPQAVERFVAERQILASLDHPNIARLLDGGMTSDGRPYFIMEYVDGTPLDAYCDQRALSIDDRLRLFCRVALAVQHAHRNLVVHRDLKPSNIMVSDDGEPKLLDFGIAKMLDPEATHGRALTEAGERVMTPEYASPEQVTGKAITTAVDIYALGLVLYELLTGHRPQRRDGMSLSEMERLITTHDPVAPSAAVLAVVERPTAAAGGRLTPEGVAATRGVSASQLRRKLRGDLDRIVMMAIRKEPARRYLSAEQLAADIQRYLEDAPVIARGDASAYRVRKFVTRNRWGVAAATMIIIALAGYAASMTATERRIRVALEQARLEAERAEQVTAFVMGLLEPNAAGDTARNSAVIRDMLRRGAARADRMVAQPAAQSEMLDVIGRVHQRLGDYGTAQTFLERALALRRNSFGDQHTATAESMQHLAALLSARGQYGPAQSLYVAAITVQRNLLGDEHPKVARSLDGLGVLLQSRGDYVGAERLSRQALTARRVMLGTEHPEIAQSMSNLALQLQLQGRYTEAESLYRDALAMRQRLFRGEHTEVAAGMSGLGLLYFTRGDLVQAESLYRGALAMRRRALGDEHPEVSQNLGLLGAVLRRKGDVAAAESVYHEAIAIGRRTLGDEHPDLAHTINGLAIVHRDKGEPAAAESLFRVVLKVRRRTLGVEHPAIAMSLTHLGTLLQSRGEVEGAEPLLLQALAMRRKLLGDGHPQVAESARQLVSLYESSGGDGSAYAALIPAEGGRTPIAKR